MNIFYALGKKTLLILFISVDTPLRIIIFSVLSYFYFILRFIYMANYYTNKEYADISFLLWKCLASS